MSSRTELVDSMNYIRRIMSLTSDNEYSKYISNQLNPVYYELQRQVMRMDGTSVYK
jgi:hypothetical protein